MAQVLLLLGGDRGDLPRTFARTEELLALRVGRILGRSRDHWSEPWGFRDDQLFLNRAVLAESGLTPQEVMRTCLAIEAELGRVRAAHEEKKLYGPRTIDIDILLIEDRIIAEEGLQVPHPRMHERAFALAPAADIVPGQLHPQLGRSVLSLLGHVHEHATEARP